MRFSGLVEVSNAVARTRSRLEKTARLAGLLSELRGGEVQVGVAYLSGSLPQGRIGIGWSALAGLREAGSSDEGRLDLLDVDAAFEQLAQTKGAGSALLRAQRLATLFARATREEQDFLIRLISGEIRQGAVEGVLAEAIAKAAGVPADAVRAASMMCGDLGEVARVAMAEGA